MSQDWRFRRSAPRDAQIRFLMLRHGLTEPGARLLAHHCFGVDGHAQ